MTLTQPTTARRTKPADRDQLFSQFGDAIYNYLFAMNGSEKAAVNQTVETFHRAFRNAELLRYPPALRVSLFRLAYDSFLQGERSSRMKRSVLDWAASSLGCRRTLQPEDDPGKTAEHEHTALQSALLLAIQALPERQRCVMVLRGMEHWTNEDVAQVLRCSTGEVTELLMQANARLKNRLSPFVGQMDARPVSSSGPA
ncbi:MAG: sigma-70 family RNA polymerase sigma factor [Armatimonadota bacterium]|nr:sigma-70 family RNA polymerase sigma factor [Armatimonadota bacterium]